MKAILNNRLFWPVMALVVAAAGGSPVLALVLGAALALVFGNPCLEFTGRFSKYLLQGAVVLLGFGLELGLVLKVGASSIGMTFVTISGTMVLAFLLSRMFRVGQELTTLLGGGTAICGGSAIAAIAPAIGAGAANTAMALAVVFLLNALGLVIFPPLGRLFGLDQEAFGLWSALAIHDTSSVVGAAAIYGDRALAVATTVKLTRALWILPVSFACARFAKGKSGAKVPWFLGGFLLAAVVRSGLPAGTAWWDGLAESGRFLMTVTLFLIGTGMTGASLKSLGARPLFLAIVLWVLVSVGSLAAILAGWLQVDVPISLS